jgi:iron(III) transport system ATP-binding protein
MIEISHLSKSFADRGAAVAALDDVSLSIANGAFFTLLGPSGCGKTTLLRCIAGLETPDTGEIRINGEVVFSRVASIDIPVHRRRIGMVFQSYAIWPHMTVFDNVAFPLTAQKKDRVEARVMKALEAVELAALARRPATRLSGGQQQRVALARAIVAEPAILLLDEPLSNLDAGLREQMRTEMRRLQRRLDLTTVLVTHDQEEALSLSDRIALLRVGRVVEQGTPQALYREPQSIFAAEFIGAANVLDGVVEPSKDDLVAIRCSIGTLWSTARAPAGPAKVVIRPEKLRIEDHAGDQRSKTHRNTFHAEVIDRKFLGGVFDVEFAIDTGENRVVLRGRVSEIDAQDQCVVSIDPVNVQIIAAD